MNRTERGAIETMCGIAGFLYADADSAGRPAHAPGDDGRRHRPPRARRRGLLGRAGRRPGPPPAVDHRPGRRRPADRQRGRLGPGRLQRRDLQLPGAARRAWSPAGTASGPRSDTEVLVHLYEEQGERPGRAAAGDVRLRPLGPAASGGCCWPATGWASSRCTSTATPRSCCSARSSRRSWPTRASTARLDPAALEDYLTYGMVPGSRSIFARSREAAAGPHAAGPGRRPRPVAARDTGGCRFEPDHRPSAEEWAEEIRAKVAEAVRLHLIADVPVGAFLSGGLDSSIVVGLAGRRRADGPLQTFSIGFREEAFSELPAARLVARRYGTRHVEEVVTPDAVALIDELTHHYDEPFADSSAVPTFLVSRLAAPERQGRALGRRRRRGLRRLRPLRPRPEGGGRAPAAAGLVPPRGARPAGPGLPEGRLAPPAAAGQDGADEPVAGRRPVPTPTRCRCAGRRCGVACWPQTWPPP